MDDIRLGVIGYGFRGAGLLGMARSVERLQPTAVCDETQAARDQAKADFPEVALFDDPLSMITSGSIDAVMVETPPMSHADQAIAALENNIHVLSDVPAIHSLDEVGPLWEAAEKSTTIYMFGATANYFGFVQTCSDLIAKGLLGKPFYLEAEYIHDLREFSKTTPWRIGYEPIRYCTHSLGPLLEWLGKELVTVSCFGSGSHIDKDAGDDAMLAMFRTESGELVKLMVSFSNSNSFGRHHYLCHATHGTFECTWPLTGEEPKVSFSSNNIYGFEKTINLVVSSGRPEHATMENLSGHGSLDYATLVDFVKAIDGEPCSLGLQQAFRMTLPGLYALESAVNGGRVTKIKYPWSRNGPDCFS
ncbi:MAG: Gfo/Idh/MocA family oxidoreductase [Pirellulales bacterium]|nr:Gfo/Idh/MocA family oxidoreductase [Pirellulales bacterium]